ncbi:glycosyltransferase family 4 protein [Phreatobacter sp.]|uniref:glycosyltransferase family 4 protein n=1 Tax=Phreatobacter sp. TaxID=1966341 RepID=UPI003F6FF99E
MTQPVKAAFAIPGEIDTPTGGYRYDREVLGRAGRYGIDLRHVALPASFPFPAEGDLAATATQLAAIPADTVLLADGLAFGALPAAVLDAIRTPVVALVHHPLALESGLAAEVAAKLADSERQALARAAAVVATSAVTARTLAADYGVPAERITVAEPGTDPAPRATGSGNDAPTLLAVGAVSARKGYAVLMDALGPLRGLDWTLVIAGATDRDPAAFAHLRRAVGSNSLGSRVTFAGPLSDAALDRLYGLADIFVMPSLYEGYGMVLAEAMARGLPMVTTTGGAAAETVPEGAALKVPPGDAAELKQAIARLIGDRALRQSLSDAAWVAGSRLPRWDDTARIIADVICGVAGGTGR